MIYSNFVEHTLKDGKWRRYYVSQNDIEIVVKNEVQNDKLPASRSIITRETNKSNESTSKEHIGDGNEQHDTTISPLEDTIEETNLTNTQNETIDRTNSITGKLNQLDLTTSTYIISGCKIGSKNMLRCNVCRHKIHLQCTQLPPYQLFHFLYTKSYRRYVCEECTDQLGQLPNHITDNIAHTAQLERTKIESLEETLHLKVKENQISINELHDSKTRVAELENRLEILRKLVKDQEATIEIKNQTAQRRDSKNTKENSESQIYSGNINDTLKQFSTDIINTVSKVVDEKLSAINQKIQNIAEIPEKIKENCKSYKDALFSNIATTEDSNTTSLKGMIKDAISERQSDIENVEERKTNIIVFNAPESEANSTEERKLDDKAFFVETCNSFCDRNIPSTDILQARRLGKRSEGKGTRPLLIKL